ncbi:hypothetical protein LIER_26897 [Lithospermum erythrorhizon]|uniref:Uncharacterized protein n=1 Tax=Lithospermum erythrorhizon TaxID=34254 RepID=A0AAV3RDQ5_LITER
MYRQVLDLDPRTPRLHFCSRQKSLAVDYARKHFYHCGSLLTTMWYVSFEPGAIACALTIFSAHVHPSVHPGPQLVCVFGNCALSQQPRIAFSVNSPC